ncbi:MAG: hypothetical protein QF535_03515 [Anaerolineales bacterium]|nr:hypothetical protein [Anaerolineales bacterium]
MSEIKCAVAAPNPIDEIRQNNRKVLDLMERDCPDLIEWARMLGRRGCNLIDGTVLTKLDGDRLGYKILYFTQTHNYSIKVLSTRGADVIDENAYLGCQLGERKPLAGCEYIGGRDCLDGSYSKETWCGIVADMLSFELVRLGK